MDRAIRKEIIRLWDAMLPLEQIYQMLPCKLADAKRYVANLREDGTLKPRHKKEKSLHLVAEAYRNVTTDVDELAEMFSFTRGTIMQYLFEAGVHRNRPSTYHLTKEKKASERKAEIMRQIKESGLSQTEIAKKYGVSRQYIHQLSNEL